MKKLTDMSDQEIAARIVGYVNRIQNLKTVFLEKSHSSNSIDIAFIHCEYKNIKQEVKDDAHYLSLTKNKYSENSSFIYYYMFSHSIIEASKYGFSTYINRKISIELYDSLDEALYNLTKYYSLDKWITIMQDDLSTDSNYSTKCC